MSLIAELLTRVHGHLMTPKQRIEMQEVGERSWWKHMLQEAERQGIEVTDLIQADAAQQDTDSPEQPQQPSPEPEAEEPLESPKNPENAA